MQAAANHSIPFYVLDRPNPIGNTVSGWVSNLFILKSYIVYVLFYGL